MRLVFDIEGDDLLLNVKNIWCICTHDLDTHEKRWWRAEDPEWKEYLGKATTLIGHFILGYDLPALKKIYGFEPHPDCAIFDTLIMSIVQDYKRFDEDGHSIDRWGEFFGIAKSHFNDFSRFSPELLERCQIDVEINVKAFKHLIKELNRMSERAINLRTYIKAEHYVQRWNTAAHMHGWPFDKEGGLALFDKLDVELQNAHEALDAKLGMKCVAVDKKKGVIEPKQPKWTKQGFYDAHTANWFDIDPCSGYEGEERMVLGPYSRVAFKRLDLGSVSDVKIFLFRNGWQPTTWNWKFDPVTKKKKQGAPKITDDSLEFLGGDGKLYSDYLTSKSRYDILKTWLENVDDNGMLHGDCISIGTPSMRTRHTIIVNVPTGETNKDGSAISRWGPEMRKLFGCLPGWKLIGCDSASNQARGLAHYLGDKEYIETLIHGDIHMYNANVLTSAAFDLGMTEPVTRPKAKRILYAFLFGAGGDKLWSYAYGSMNSELGNKLKSKFIKAVPGFQELIEKLSAIYGKTSKDGYGYIPSIAGNKIYVDSFHKLLVYLLQACEKITCSAAVMLIMQRLEEEKIPYVPLIMYHDEADFMVPEEFAERAAVIGKQAFADGPKLFGITIMDGGAKIGNNWYEVH